MISYAKFELAAHCLLLAYAETANYTQLYFLQAEAEKKTVQLSGWIKGN